MKGLLFLTAVLFISSFQLTNAQDFAAIISGKTGDEALDPSILAYNEYADNLPQPVGGLKKMIKKIDYPVPAIFSKTEGVVILLAFIDEYGDVKAVKIAKDIGFGCGEAAAKVIAGSKFTPALRGDKNIPVKAVIPVKFQLYRNFF